MTSEEEEDMVPAKAVSSEGAKVRRWASYYVCF